MNKTQLFKNFEQEIFDFVINQDIDYYSISDKNFKLAISDAVFCIKDIKRNKLFFDAIYKAIIEFKKHKKNILVVDAGSGTGILGLFALKLGADKCIFIEDNPYTIDLNKKVIDYFNYSKSAEFIQGDACNIKLKSKYDILISETIVSNIAQEDFPIIINNLKKYGKKNSIIIPESIELEILENLDNNNLYKHKFSFESNKGLYPQNVYLKKPNTQEVIFQSTLNLYKDIQIKTGDCPLFINQIKFNISEDNSMFNFLNKT